MQYRKVVVAIILLILLFAQIFFFIFDSYSHEKKILISKQSYFDNKDSIFQLMYNKSNDKTIQTSPPINIRSSDHSPIWIDNNDHFNTSNGVIDGSGLLDDPYIIDGWSINGSRGGPCIYIGNTTVHFVVRNCYLYGADSDKYIWGPFNGAGIGLNNVTNGKIINNYISLNNEDGIVVFLSKGNIIMNNTIELNWNGIEVSNSNENIISNNIVLSNGYGIFLESSNNNTIVNNTSSMNNAIGIVIYYSSCANIIKDNIVKNNDGDGIHVFMSSNMNNITNNIIENNQYGFSISFNSCSNIIVNNIVQSNEKEGIYIEDSTNNNIFRNNFIDNNNNCIQAYNDDSINHWNTSTGEGNYWNDYKFQYSMAINDGVVWNIPYEINHSTDEKDYYPLVRPTMDNIIHDNVPPVINIINMPETYNATTGDEFFLMVNIEDDVDYSPYNLSAFIEYWFSKGQHTNTSMDWTEYPLTWNAKIQVPSNSTESFQFFISAKDSSSNWINTPVYDVNVIDNDPPEAKIGIYPLSGNGVIDFEDISTDNIQIVNRTWIIDGTNFSMIKYDKKISSNILPAQGNYTIKLIVRDAAFLFDEDIFPTYISWDEIGISPTKIEDMDGDGINDTNDWDIDGDDVENTLDSFPTDPSASIDTDSDGSPDSWNPGMGPEDSTTGLTLDPYPNDPDNIPPDDDDDDDTNGTSSNNSNTWIWIAAVAVIVVVIALVVVVFLRKKPPTEPDDEVGRVEGSPRASR